MIVHEDPDIKTKDIKLRYNNQRNFMFEIERPSKQKNRDTLQGNTGIITKN